MPQHAFTLIEMLTTLAVLIILLGLMVSLARHVRNRSANALTEALLVKLDRAMSQYAGANHRQMLPAPPFIPAEGQGNEKILQTAARANNQVFVHFLRQQGGLSDEIFRDLPISIYDQVTLRDAWGNPIVFMPQMHPAVGMAPQDRHFFFSAGPDRRFLTKEDNLYSYEASAEP